MRAALILEMECPLKKWIGIILATTIVLAAVVLHLPHNLNSALRFNKSSGLTVTYTVSRADVVRYEEIPRQESESKFFKGGTEDFQYVSALLDKYSYHETLSTLTSNLSIVTTGRVSGDYVTILISDGETSLTIANCSGSNAIVDSNLCQIGYWGDKKVSELATRLMNIVKNAN
jgi:hypothetical protein